MGKILTSDGETIDWPYACAPTTSLPADTVRALMSKDPVTACVAAADIPSPKARQLYRGSSFVTFNMLRSIGRKIVEHDVAKEARGMSQAGLRTLLGTKTRRDALERIAAWFL